MKMSRRLLLLAGLGTAANGAALLLLDRLQRSPSVAQDLDPSPVSTVDPADPSASGSAVAEAEVTIRGFQYQPSEIVLQRGGTVTFTNQDSTPHTVTPRAGSQFEASGRLRRGENHSVTFDTAGSQEYFCDIHPSMGGRVVVVG